MDSTAPRTDDPTPDARPSRRRRLLRKIVLGIIVAILAAWLVLFITKGRFLKRPFESIVGGLMHRTVDVRGDFQLYFAPLRIKFYAEGVTVSNPAWATRPALFTADRIEARIAPLSLLFGKRHIYWLDLVNGAVDLEWNRPHSTNSWTFSGKKGGEPLAFPRIDVATVTGTQVHYLDPRMRLLANVAVDDIKSQDARIGKAVGVKGDGRLRDTPFTVTARLLSPDATANRGKNELVARMRAAGNTIDVAGTLPSIADIENVPLRTLARGRDMSTLLGIIGVAIPRTRTYRIHAQLVKAGEEYRFTRMAGTFGNSDLAGRLTVTNGDRIHLDSQLATRRLDIIDAAPFIGYNPDIVAEKGAVAAAAATGAAPQRLLPDAPLPIETMQLFDADLKWTVGMVRSRNLPISDIDLTLDLERGKLTLSPLTFAMARGNVASDMIFDTRQRPSVVTYDIRLAPTPLGRLLAGYGLAESGTSGTIKGRIELKGRGDSIHDSLSTSTGRIAFVMPQGTLWTRNVQLAELDLGTFVQKMFEDKLKKPVQMNCGLIGFTVRNGVAAADPILIDTSKNVIVGRGGFSFRNEAVDLAFRADGKKFSFLSGQSPVGVGGYFAKPSLNVISSQLLSRAGAGLGLALVATPIAGVLAFVDVGDAKATACGPVLAGATASQQQTTKGEPRDDVGHGTTATAEDGEASKGAQKNQRKKFLGIF
ncbi:AsmA family protein [Sphingomonas sp. Leaf339]|uniref:AsmA family protein n=1 Tax=Sphingomonas sp. Leaf339 TaxID=1736343 RepID=UPI0006F7417F|nr:AsmA family protein [Sphingomonas sp. Leaf339]KQU62520.1 AsmA family protein [Sphingomonas sp. Leaf339]